LSFRKEAFTLVELLVAAFISLIILAAFFSFSSSVLRELLSALRESASSSAEHFAAELIKEDIKYAGVGVPTDEVALEATDETLTLRSSYITTNEETRGWAVVNCTYSGAKIVDCYWEEGGCFVFPDGKSVEGEVYFSVLDSQGKPATPDGKTTTSFACDEQGLFFIFAREELSSLFSDITYQIGKATSKDEFCSSYSVLHRVINHNEGKLPQKTPILSCAESMKVLFLVEDAGELKFKSPEVFDPVADKEYLKKNLKKVNIYVLRKLSPQAAGRKFPEAVITSDDGAVSFDLEEIEPDYKNFKWKIVKISEEPINFTGGE